MESSIKCQQLKIMLSIQLQLTHLILKSSVNVQNPLLLQDDDISQGLASLGRSAYLWLYVLVTFGIQTPHQLLPSFA